MSKKAKRILKGVLLSGLVVGLFAIDITVCSKIGADNEAKRVAAEYKARDYQSKLGFAEIMGNVVAKDKAEKQANLEKLKNDLQEDAINHKNDKPVQASKQKTEQEIKDSNLG